MQGTWKRRIACVGLVLGAAIALPLATGVLLLRGGMSARPEPSALEALAARAIRRAATPGTVRGLVNPVPLHGTVLADARAHFADHCASCHGNDGKGRTAMGRALYPRSPDLTAGATQGLSDGELFHVIEEGIRFTGMPGWGTAGRPEESWKLVHFIRHLPQVTEDELREMEALNPRSPGEWEELREEQRFLEGAGGDAPGPPGHHH